MRIFLIFPLGAETMASAPFLLGSIFIGVVRSGGMPVPDHCFCVGRFNLLYIHATAGYQNNACADHKDCTDDVEDRGTDATGGGKLCARIIGNSRFLFKVSCHVA